MSEIEQYHGREQDPYWSQRADIKRWVSDLVTTTRGMTPDVTALGVHEIVPGGEVVIAEVVDLADPAVLGHTDVPDDERYVHSLMIYRSIAEYVEHEVVAHESISYGDDGTFFAYQGQEELVLVTPEERQAIIDSFRIRYHIVDLCQQSSSQKNVTT